MLEGFIKPTIIFFGLTSFLATFQITINDIFRDLVNTSYIVAFINDVIIVTDFKVKHNGR